MVEPRVRREYVFSAFPCHGVASASVVGRSRCPSVFLSNRWRKIQFCESVSAPVVASARAETCAPLQAIERSRPRNGSEEEKEEEEEDEDEDEDEEDDDDGTSSQSVDGERRATGTDRERENARGGGAEDTDRSRERETERGDGTK